MSCGEQEAPANVRECTDQQQENICEAAIGVAGDHGVWLNFDGGALDNHCQFNWPGYSNRDFQLNPGQSAANCLNKND